MRNKFKCLAELKDLLKEPDANSVKRMEIFDKLPDDKKIIANEHGLKRALSK